MAKARSPNRYKAYDIYKKSKGELKPKDIAKMLGITDNQVRKWKSQDKWDDMLNGTLPEIEGEPYNPNDKLHPEKARWGNKNTVGHGPPKGNLNSLKHGAYQKIYEHMLSDEEKKLYDQTTADVSIDSEIRLLRLKIARLLNREKTFFYDMFGKKHEKEISEEDRERGILACMDQLKRFIETKATISGDSEKLTIEKEKFEFNKYKTDIELQLKKERLALQSAKVNGTGEGEELESDGFIEALAGTAQEDWIDDEET